MTFLVIQTPSQGPDLSVLFLPNRPKRPLESTCKASRIPRVLPFMYNAMYIHYSQGCVYTVPSTCTSIAKRARTRLTNTVLYLPPALTS